MSRTVCRWILPVGLCVSVAAFAQSPTVVVYPLEFKRVPPEVKKEDKEALKRDQSRLLLRAGAVVPDFTKSEAALVELKRGDCEREDACLSQLATLAGALYGLYASVDYSLDGTVVVSGRVIRDDGKVVSPTETVRLPKGKDPFKDIARNGLTALYDLLKVKDLPAERPAVTVTPPVEKTPPNNVVTDPPPPLPPLVDTSNSQRSAGQALVGAGVGVAVVGGVLFGIGQGIGGGLNPTDGAIDSERVGDFRAANGLCTAGVVSLSVGAAAAIVGAIVWGTAPAPVAVSVAPVNGGAMVGLGGEF